MKPKNTWSKRRGSRGVAMVEAGILAPIFAMMMMLNVYLGGVYEKKYISVNKARFQTWSNASNSANNGPAAAQNQDQPPNNPCNGSTPPGGSASASASMFMCKGQDDEVWNYGPTLRFNGGAPKTIHTEGMVVCNEKNNGYNPIGYISNEFGQLFGSLSSGSSSNPCP
jgi:hypothetical protein